MIIYLCSVGHKGKFGHEFMEFELTSNGRLRYSNNSNYKNDVMIRKEGIIITNCSIVLTIDAVVVSPSVIAEVKRIIEDSEVMKEDDHNWPEPDRVGKQELEIKIGSDKHVAFTVGIHQAYSFNFNFV